MLIIRRHATNPFINLATEEYILKHFNENSFMLWRNEPAVIVGKHQNTLAEINVEYVKKKNIPVVRRLSGGGAVFHDLGNLNFTFIRIGQEEQLIDFRKYTQPILEVLQKLDIEAKFEGRNDLTIGGKKFSGNAEHIWKNRVLHHGTLLFSATMTDLSQALNVDPRKFQDKSVKSVRSRVTNISEHLKHPMDVVQFSKLIEDHIVEKNPEAHFYELTEDDHRNIADLVREKYETWEWNFGYSPKYNFKKILRTEKSGTIEYNLDVQNGMIMQIKIFGDFFGKHDIEEVENSLKGVAHREDDIMSVLKPISIGNYISNLTAKEFIDGLF